MDWLHIAGGLAKGVAVLVVLGFSIASVVFLAVFLGFVLYCVIGGSIEHHKVKKGYSKTKSALTVCVWYPFMAVAVLGVIGFLAAAVLHLVGFRP